MRSVDDLVRDAFQALLRGDTAERDRLIAQAKSLLAAGERLRNGGPLVVGEPIQVKAGAICLPDRSRERVN